MTRTDQDGVLWSGETKYIDVTIYDKDGLQLSMVAGVVTWRLDTSPPLIKSSATSSILLNVPTAGQIRVVLDPNDTASVLPGRYTHQAAIVDPSGHDSMLLEGSIQIKRRLQ